jgi:SsrA-binding protein
MVRGNDRVITVNRKARHNYEIIETFEAGMALVGTEVKSLREGRGTLTDAYAMVERDELFLIDAEIALYPLGTYTNHEPRRKRKLLMKGREIKRLAGKLAERGLSLIPLQLYFKGPWVKVELGLGKGKKLHDKRETIKKREADREMHREIKERSK